MADTPSIVLATSNGAGMGHLARQLAVGLSLGDAARVTLFSHSMALPTVTAMGIGGEYCPGPGRDWVAGQDFDRYLADRLTALIDEVSADVVVFDGVAPYRGVTLAGRRRPGTAFVWFRRGMWQPGVNQGQLWKSQLFDLIVEPGDLAAAADMGATAGRDDATRVGPVSLAEVVTPLPREDARSELGLDPDRPALLLALGTGRLGEVEGPGNAVLEAVLGHPGWQVGVVTSAIAERRVLAPDHPSLVEISGVFPLVGYLSAFDAAVAGAGYNAVHELIPAGLATLLFPNRHTRTDDQVARARHLADEGIALAAMDLGSLRSEVEDLLDDGARAELEARIGAHPGPMLGGAEGTAAALTALASGHRGPRESVGERLARARDDLKEAVKRAAGPSGVNLVRRALGREVLPAAARTRVAEGDGPPPGVRQLTYPTDPSVADLMGSDPVEHILPGSSGAYMAARRLVADAYYEIVTRR